VLMIIGVGTFIINFSGPASSQRHDPRHRAGHALSCTPFPEEPANLEFCTIAKGKYKGQRAIEVRLDGRRVGELTRAMSERYEATVQVSTQPVGLRSATPGACAQTKDSR
jgi:hypothetical protein